ncbi:MAG TPA: archease [Kiritimatiellia bacterium]|nr:archease [Kiritimatiellia bacterium]HRZ12488.1 archease [Kiritimatiellia bacterium]HSA17754.1 archease [Kiritimatiellia bacterium]
MTAARWEHFEHQADVGLRGRGGTPDEAFAQIALALTAVVTDPDRVRAERPVELRCSASDVESLLVDWLNALVYEMAARRMVFSRFEVRVEGSSLQATAWGESIEPERHRPAVEVKAATYHALAVRREPDGGWTAQCVVDV